MTTREGNHIIIEGKGLIKDFVVGKKNIRVLRGLSFDIYEGEFVMINGPSGCGKSTLMNIMNGWDGPTSGTVLVDGEDLYTKNENQRAKALRGRIGMVHQAAFWVKSLSVIDNVAIPYMLDGYRRKDSKKRAFHLLRILGLEGFQNYKPMDLSGGQQQRISLLRSLVNNPKILMADEPTGNLDTKSSDLLMELFKSINEELGRTIVMVTHNLELLPYATKVIHILDGQITKIDINKPPFSAKNQNMSDILDISKSFVKSVQEEEHEEEMAAIG